jgi:hypothetical protein
MKTAHVWKVDLRSVVFLLPWLLAAPLFADAGDPPARVARLSSMKGTVSLQPSGANDWSQASLNYPVTTGDRIYTDQGSQAELEVGTAAVRASEATDLTLANLNDQFMQLGLGQGTIRVRVYELPSGTSLEVDTPNGALTLLRPGDYRVETYPGDTGTLVIVNSGSLEVSGGGLSQTVESGQAVKLTGTEPIQVSFVSLPSPDGFDQWCRERDRRFASSASARYVSREIPGYYDLDTYGRWQEVPGYGPVWYPAGVPAGWVPYRMGHWVWVEPWGWTWVEHEPWGFAPFHYGRWVYVGSAWGWLPGPLVVRPYYAPALVAFIGGPHFSVGISIGGGVGIQAWFPLGPGEPYLPWYHHGGGYLRQVNVTNVRNVTNITNITNITNVNNIRYVNQRVATTVVPTTVFRSGQRIDRQVVQVSPEQLARAQVIPHPETVPTARALGGGRPAPNPPRVARVTTIPATGQRLPPTSRANQPYQPPPMTRNAPAGTGAPGVAPRTAPLQPITKNARTATGEAGGSPRTPPRWVTRNPLPPPNAPFSTRQQAMQTHPGRPLEPQQMENLRAGKPAGSMRDREVPPHPAPAPRAERPQPSRSPEPKTAPRSGEEHRH